MGAGVGVGEGQGWVRGAAPGTLPLLCHGTRPWGRWLTQQPKLETELSEGGTYVGDACNEQDGRSKSGNDAGTAVLQHHPLYAAWPRPCNGKQQDEVSRAGVQPVQQPLALSPRPPPGC